MEQLISKRKKSLIIQFHTTLNRAGMMKQKPAILESLGVESTKELEEKELVEVIKQLNTDADKWRKRVIAAIFGWCNAINLDYDVKKVKAVATRAAGAKNFNSIPVSRLRDVYYEFVRKSKATVDVQNFKEEQRNYLENRN